MNTLKKAKIKTANLLKQIKLLVQTHPMITAFSAVIIIIICVFVYMYLTYIWTDKVILVLQDNSVDGRIGKTIKDVVKLSDTTNTYSCTFCFWLKLRSMSNMQQVETNYILSYDAANNTTNTPIPQFDIIYGDLIENGIGGTSLNQIKIMFKDMEDKTDSVTITDIHLQKWLCIGIVMRDLIIDIYVNGELVSSKTLNYIPTPIPILSDTGTLYIGKDNGFNGTMTKLTYFNYGVSESDIQKYYLQGY